MNFFLLILTLIVVGIFMLKKYGITTSGMNPKAIKKIGTLIAIAVIVLVVLVKSIVIIQPGYVGIQILFGTVLEKTLENGVHVINPLCNIKKMNVRLAEYTMSKTSSEGERSGNDSISTLTSEGLQIALDLTVWYKLDPKKAQDVYKNIGLDYKDKVIRPLIRTVIRNVTSSYLAKEIYSKDRSVIVQKIEEQTRPVLLDKGFMLDRILLRNVTLPEKLAKSIDEKLSAEQAAEQMKFVLDKEEREKERKIIEAEGIRKANQLISQGLTSNYIKWYRIEMMKKLVNSPNNTVIFIPEDLKSAPALINLKNK